MATKSTNDTRPPKDSRSLDDRIAELMMESFQDRRIYAGTYYSRNKDIMEWKVVWYLTTSLWNAGGPKYNQIEPRGQGNDPPDCEGADEAGNRIGFEVTEIVDEKAIREAIKEDDPDHYVDWNRDKLLSHIRNRLSAKDRPGRVKGGPYHKYILVMHSNEDQLTHGVVEKMLAGVTFEKPPLIDEAYLLLFTDDNHGEFRFVKLKFE